MVYRSSSSGRKRGGSCQEEEWEVPDLRAKLKEAEDRRIRAEEELKNLQVCRNMHAYIHNMYVLIHT